MSSGTSTFEHAYYIGNYMGGILYGIALGVYGMILYSLNRLGNRTSAATRNFCIIFSTVMILASTVDAAASSAWGADLWITRRDSPGGVPAFIKSGTKVWFETLGSASIVISALLGDTLLLWRLYIIYDRSMKVIYGPAIAFLAAFGLSIAQIIFSGRPSGDSFGTQAINVSVAYYAITICLNLLATVLISMRLLHLSKRVSLALGEDSADTYVGPSAICVESAALYTIMGIIYLIPYALQHDIAVFFGQLWSKMSVIAPLLIILRVVDGSAWRQEVLAEKLTALHFARTSYRPDDVRPSSKSFQLSCVVLREVQVTR
ncbi:hypothetical protein CVT24_006882 [Panaeolus cyanescens]|uniref:G-protein coupled receptors family 1 profile domain-containing protein n=1 Tax=Panaeolus cyanescens TaxID=181874 RepID=A0A409YX21_9AGAR|nr:hypothetical protein CVT24_006882 [Panaeolus cyanescens]